MSTAQSSAPVAVQAAQPAQHVAAGRGHGLEAGADDDALGGDRVAHRQLGGDRQAAAGLDPAGLRADEAPVVEVAAGQAVGDAERLQHGGQRHQREAGQEQDGDLERHGTIRQVCGRIDQ